jgi:hypothetical protein
LKQVHTDAIQTPETLRISLDTKAKVKIGEFSRGGVARGQESVRAADHDMHPDALLVPAGILEVDSNQLNIVFGTSRDTSDFVADCLELWWTNRQSAHLGVRRLLIDLDNGPEIASSRTQFMKRLVEFSDQHQLTLELAYYPPYHSKYNRVERCWGILGTDLGFVSAFNRLVSSARGSCSRRVIGLLMSLCFVLEMTIVWRAVLGVLVPGALMRPFVSLSCSREDDRLVG